MQDAYSAQDAMIASIAQLKEGQDYIKQRLDKQDEVVNTIHNLTSEVKVMNARLEQQMELFKSLIETFNDRIKELAAGYDERLKGQGERIEKTNKRVDETNAKIAELEKRPAVEAHERAKATKHHMRNAVISSVVSVIVGAAVTVLIFLASSGAIG